MAKELVQVSIPRLTADVEPWEEFSIVLEASQFLMLLIGGALNTLSLFRWTVSSTGLVLSTRQSLVKAWNWFRPISFTYLAASIAGEPTISLVSRATRSGLSSSEGFPSSCMTLTSERTSSVNEAWTLSVWSWWRMLSCLPECWFPSWNSSMTLATSAQRSSNGWKQLDYQWGQLPHNLLWCRLCSARVPGRLGLMRRSFLSVVSWSSLL